MAFLVFSFQKDQKLANEISIKIGARIGKINYRDFPDGESYIQIQSNVKDIDIIFIDTLYQPNINILPLYLFAKGAHDLGAKSITLVSPYLSYMRQDIAFNPGEVITSKHFASLLSMTVDRLITVDPHLHRYSSLNEIYSIPTTVLHAGPVIADWILANVDKPVLFGPDSESNQWVSRVAKLAEKSPFFIFNKIRRGDRDVEISVPNIEQYLDCTPVLVDDIISTGRTMIETIIQLHRSGFKRPVCIGIHAVFAGDAYQQLVDAGVDSIVTCNSIPHVSNRIDLSDLIIDALMNNKNE